MHHGVTRRANANTFNLFTGNMVPAPSTHSGGKWSNSQAIYEIRSLMVLYSHLNPESLDGQNTLGDKIILRLN